MKLLEHILEYLFAVYNVLQSDKIIIPYVGLIVVYTSLRNVDEQIGVGAEEGVASHKHAGSSFDKDNGGQIVQEIEKRKAVATISETSDEWSKYTIVVRNNFDEDATDSLGNLKYGPRKFYFELILGPVEYTDVIDNYALGTVTLSSFIFSTGKTYQYTDDTNEVETDNYQYYKLLSNTATGDPIALYAGFDSDYEADETDSESYSLITSASNIGQIIDNPTTAKFYTGIEAGHYYITGDENDSVKINNNAYAGLINSKYIST